MPSINTMHLWSNESSRSRTDRRSSKVDRSRIDRSIEKARVPTNAGSIQAEKRMLEGQLKKPQTGLVMSEDRNKLSPTYVLYQGDPKPNARGLSGFPSLFSPQAATSNTGEPANIGTSTYFSPLDDFAQQSLDRSDHGQSFMATLLRARTGPHSERFWALRGTA